MARSDRGPRKPSVKSQANQQLARAMRELRRIRGESQEDFARRAGIDRSYYGALERAEFNVGLDKIVQIAAALEVSACDLLGVAEL
jgi:transcriptional regulator with XRE-family HTH domain